MRVPIDSWEKHNVVRRDGKLRTRDGLVSIATPEAGKTYVASWTVESPFTGEVLQHLVERATATGVCTLRVMTEEFAELYTVNLGAHGLDVIVGGAVVNNQQLVGGPGIGTLYGLASGGLIPALKTESGIEGFTALEVPRGHVAVFGDRFVIAAGHVELFNSARPDADPRTFVADNAAALPGTIHDHFEGPEGAFYAFTSSGMAIIPRDVIAQNIIQPSASFFPDVQTVRPRNAVPVKGGVAILQERHVELLGPGKNLDLFRYSGRRFWSKALEEGDLRRTAELFRTSRGFLVGFRGARGYFVDVDLVEGTHSFVWSTESAFNVVGTLRDRDGETLIVLEDRVVQQIGNDDFDHAQIRGVLCGQVDLPANRRPKLRRVYVAAANVGEVQRVQVGGQFSSKETPARPRDVTIGTDAWSREGRLFGRSTRSVRHAFTTKESKIQMEIAVEGGAREIDPAIELEFVGQGGARVDRR